MKIVVPIDSFKGSLSSIEAGRAVEKGILKVNNDAEVVVCPLADGGEGTVDALAAGLGGRLISVTVKGPLLEPVDTVYCILPDGTAVIEMAKAAGLPLINTAERNPMKTTTLGVGELIKDAIGRGCRHFVVGIGGSATNDGGTGMLTALGYEFLNGKGEPVEPGAEGLLSLESISDKNIIGELKECTFRIACDVTNPLCGEKGASAIYGPQKGATPEMIPVLDKALSTFAKIAETASSKADMNYPGAGAAGGMGFGFLTFTNASLESGIKIVIEETGLEEQIKCADLIVTGEGRLDGQTAMGKAPIGVAKLAKKYGKKVIAFCGCVGEGAEKCNEEGIDAYFPILRNITSLEEAMKKEIAYRNLEETAEQVFRLI